jgi:hypothetical protein
MGRVNGDMASMRIAIPSSASVLVKKSKLAVESSSAGFVKRAVRCFEPSPVRSTVMPFAVTFLFLHFSPLAAQTAFSPVLDAGYRQMYNLQFGDAHKTFHEWEGSHPGDPLGPTSDAAAYLFSEFDRLGVLQTQLFVDDEKFKDSAMLTPDPRSKQSFESAVTRSEQLSEMALRVSQRDENAYFAKVLNRGLRSDYLALIEKRYLASLGDMKSGGILAEKLLALDPSCYDAYLAIGVEKYILGLKPAPVRWMLRLYGAQADKDGGISKLQLVAAKGHYLAPFARLLLAVAALRDRDTAQARELLRGLAREFPNNRLYARELARLH